MLISMFKGPYKKTRSRTFSKTMKDDNDLEVHINISLRFVPLHGNGKTVISRFINNDDLSDLSCLYLSGNNLSERVRVIKVRLIRMSISGSGNSPRKP